MLRAPWRASAPSLEASEGELAAVLALAVERSVAPLVAKRLLAAAPGTRLDAATREQAERIRFAALVRHRAARERLGLVLGALGAASVPAVPWKGPIFAEQAYEDPASRVSVDLDLLIDERDLERAVSALAALGYAPRTSGFRGEVGLTGGVELSTSDARAPLDVHVRLGKPLLLRRAPAPPTERFLVGGVATFPPEWTLALAVMNAHQDGFALARLVDLAAFLGRTEKDVPERALAVARSFGLGGAFRIALELAAALGAPRFTGARGVPPTVLQRALARRLTLERAIDDGAPAPEDLRAKLAALGRAWLSLDSPSQSLLFAGRLVFAPRGYVANRGGVLRRIAGTARKLKS